ncbi:aarF domain-containing protein kinase 1 isoform X3 [Emydura macquarii macquarii]|uniref:aarF domain-containing protein kinase 1 isoform X3 n=1 Tax=Emydura macquarii macquarii TaxID=1129001 RepID=UPI00352A10C6
MPCGGEAVPYARGGGLFYPEVAGMARRTLKLVSLVAATSGFYLYSSKYLDLNDFGAVRVGRAIATTAVITYDYLTSLRSVPCGSQEYAYLKSQVHLRSAERLRDLCCANRGTFIKVGQHLGALDYLLPEEYTRTLKVLHSQAPQSSMQEIEQVIREDLGKEIKELFVSFEDTPLGAASLAQVHKAVLQDGRTVAVKVQHPKVQAQSSKDIFLMEILLLTVKQIFPDFEFMWLVDEAKKNLPLELDFLNEGMNAEKVAHMLKDFDFLKVPRIYWELSTRRVLLMEFVEGGQVNDRAYMERNSIDVNEDVEIRTNAAAYLPQINQLLNNVPRQMLLLLKTNDLLRGIESALHTRASASSFLNMSRCCIRAVSTYQRSKSDSLYRKAQISLLEALSLWQINLYELFLWLKGSQLGNWVIAFLSRMHHSPY